MHGFESFFFSDPDGSNKTVVSRSVPPSPPGNWQLGSHSLTLEELHGVRDAVAAALAQNPVGAKHYVKVYDTFNGPDVTFGIGNVGDPTDDTITVTGIPAWSRGKAEAFVEAVDAYAPLS